MNDEGLLGDQYANDGIYSITLPTFAGGSLVLFYVEAIANNTAQTRAYYPAGAEHEVLFFKVEHAYSGPDKIAINEFMASNAGIILDENGDADGWIELFNLTNLDIDMSNYWITDKADDPVKFVFATGTVLPANGYLIVWADEDSGTQGPLHANFRLSAAGEQIILLDPGLVVLDQVVYGQQTTNKSSARHPNGTGDFAIGDHTFNANNDGTSPAGEQGEVSLSIYPNPTDGNVFIDNRSGTDTELVIYDLSGRPLARHTVVTGLSRLQS